VHHYACRKDDHDAFSLLAICRFTSAELLPSGAKTRRGTSLLRLLHDRSLLLVAEATAVRSPVHRVKRYLGRAQLAALLN